MLKNMALSFGIADLINWDLRFIPEDELDAVMNEADILIFPYRKIDTSGVFMASIPYGKAVIASKLGIFNELINHGKNGFLIDVDAYEQLAYYLTKLIINPNLINELGTKLKDLASDELNWDNIAANTVNLYNSLLSD